LYCKIDVLNDNWLDFISEEIKLLYLIPLNSGS